MNRVVVTGLGAITPIGNSAEDFWNNAIEGKSGAEKITKFDATHFKTQFACEVRDFSPELYLDKAEIRRNDLFTQYALYASSEAIGDSGFDFNGISPFEIGVIWGTGQGGMGSFEKEVAQYSSNRTNPRFSPFFVPKIIANMASGMISIKYGLMGINYTTVSACASSNTAIMDAFNYIRLGKAKVIITGGSEAPITEASIGGFNAMKAMSTNNHRPKEASRPYDIHRNGFVIGEGAGALILEEYEHAKKRGAKIYAEITGAAMTADAFHISAPLESGVAASRAMQMALREAKLNPEELDYLNAHSTSTPVGDIAEIKAIEAVFSKRGEKRLTVSATKSMTGHLLGAAGAIEAILCIKAINHKVIPPTINTKKVDPEIGDSLDIVLGEARDQKVVASISNAFGFGGHNAVVVFKELNR